MRKILSREYIPFGSQYYRAPSPPRTEWEKDLANFAALGFNTVKFWIQWRWNNPREGEFSFKDIDELMEIAHRNGLRVILNTIVDTAPAWIYRTYPDASMVTRDGRTVGPQVQPHRQIGGLGLCFNHAPAMEHMFEFLRRTFRRYKDHPALEIWNVASEPELTSSMAEMRLYAENAERMGDMLCFCPRCRAAFKIWLGEKYGQIGALNSAWNRNYGEFTEVEIPVTRNSFNDMIDWRMFFVHTLGQNVRRRFEIAREEDGGRHALMCHHVFIQGFPVTSTANDPWSVGQYGDLHGITQMDDPMMCDVLRSCAKGKPVISAEMLMLYGYTLEIPKPVTADDVKRYVFNGVAANMKGFVFWQYRPETLAREAPAWGLTHLDGTPTPWLRSYAEVNGIVQKNASFLLDAEPRKAEVALLYSPENQVFAWTATGNEMTVTDALLGIHQALYRSNVIMDFVHSREIERGSLSPYKVIVVPFPYFLSEKVCLALAAWVKEGGVLIGECYFAGWNVERGEHQTTIPGYGLHDVFRVRQSAVAPPDADGRVEIVMSTDLAHIKRGEKVFGALAKEILSVEGAEVLATFASGEPAITVASHGKGHAILIGSYVGMPAYRGKDRANAALLTSLVDLKATIRRPTVTEGANVRGDVLTTSDGKRMLILRNLDDVPVEATIILPGFGGGLLTEQFDGQELRVAESTQGPTVRVSLRAGEVRVYRD